MIEPLTLLGSRILTEHFFLGLCDFREARGESEECQIAVICSILNRVQRKSWWGDSVVHVLKKKWQYSSLTAPNDPQLTLWPDWDDPAWLRALGAARQGLRGEFEHPLPGADSYHDVSIAMPATLASARFCGQIGRILFYDVDHDYEREALGGAAQT